MKLSRLLSLALVLASFCLIPAVASGQHLRLFGPRCPRATVCPNAMIPSTYYVPSYSPAPSYPYSSGVTVPAFGQGATYPTAPAPRPGMIGRMLEGSGSR